MCIDSQVRYAGTGLHNIRLNSGMKDKGKGKVIALQAGCDPEGG